MLEAAPDGQTDSSINVAPLLDKLDLFTVRQGSMARLTLGALTIAPVQAGPLFIQLEYTVGKNGGVGSELGCNLKWLTREDVDAAKDNENIYIVDVESLDDRVTIPASNLPHRGRWLRHDANKKLIEPEPARLSRRLHKSQAAF